MEKKSEFLFSLDTEFLAKKLHLLWKLQTPTFGKSQPYCSQFLQFPTKEPSAMWHVQLALSNQ